VGSFTGDFVARHNKTYTLSLFTHSKLRHHSEELACQEEKYLEEAVEELRAILTFNDPSPLRKGSYVWTETIVVQTSDGPENAMFYDTPANRSSAHQGRIQC